MPKNWKRRLLSGLVAASVTASMSVPSALAADDAPDFGELYTWEDVQAGLAETDEEVDAKVDALLKAMTDEEKFALLGGSGTGSNGEAGSLIGVPRLGVPRSRMYDGPAGVYYLEDTTNPPQEQMVAATWDPEMAYEYGVIHGSENQAIGGNVQLGTQFDITRMPQFGRAKDQFGEDPYLLSDMAVGETQGVQDQGVIAVGKHFAVFSQNATPGTGTNIEISEQAMHELHLPGFEAAVTEGGLLGVMSSYNKINGTAASAHSYLQETVLRQMWNFVGFTVTDWGGNSGFTLDDGTDVEMPSLSNNSQESAQALVDDGTYTQAEMDAMVDEAAGNVLTALGRAGYLSWVEIGANGLAKEDPDPPEVIQLEGRLDELDEIVAENTLRSQKIAEEGGVLLKNEEDVLPVAVDGDDRTVGIIGVGGMDLISGVGGERSYGTISEMTSPYAAMVDLLGEDRVDGAVGIDKFLYLATVRKSRICSVSILVLPPIDTGTRTDPRTASPGGRPGAPLFWIQIYPKSPSVSTERRTVSPAYACVPGAGQAAETSGEQFCVRIYPLDPLVREPAVQERRDRRLGREIRPGALHIPAERQGGDRHVAGHESRHDPGQDLPYLHGAAVYLRRQERIDPLDPHHRDDAPEETVEQVDPPTQVEGDVAVVPKDGSEHELGEHGAGVLIRAAQDRAESEEETVPPVPIGVEQHSEDHGSASPYDREGPVDQAAPAHPDPHRDPAEDGLDQVAQQGGEKEDPGQLVQPAALGGSPAGCLGVLLDRRLFFLLPLQPQMFPLQAGIGPRHAPLDRSCDCVVQGAGDAFPPPGDLIGLLDAPAELYQGRGGAEEVDDEQYQDHQQDRVAHPLGEPVCEGGQQRIAYIHTEEGQQAPDDGIFQTDIAVEIPRFLGIIPPLLPEDALQQSACDQLHGGGQYHASQEQEEGRAAQFGQEDREQDGGYPVCGGEGGVEESAVDQAALPGGRQRGLQQPAQERVYQKEPGKLINCVLHKNSLSS